LFLESQTALHWEFHLMIRSLLSQLRGGIARNCAPWPIIARRNSYVPRLFAFEDRTLLSVQFTPAPYAAPATRPDTPLTAMGGSRPVEPYVSVNPADPANIAISSGRGIRVSANAAGAFTGATEFPGSTGGDTCTTFDSAGRLFWVNITSPRGLPGISISQVNPTTGAIINQHVVDQVPDSSFFDDKDWIAADPTNNNLYVIWTRTGPGGDNSAQVLMRYSSDQGVSWSDPVRVDNGSDNFVWPATVTVAPDHMVYAAYHSVSLLSGFVPDHDAKIVVVRYNNDLTDPVRSIAEVPGRADVTFNIRTAGLARQIPGATFATAGSAQPWILADPVRPGSIYVVSEDSNNGFHQDYGDIRLARSTDYGATWSSSLIDTSSALFPNAAIDQFGDIVVYWYDNRRGLNNAAGHFKLDVYATYSTDGGVTFAPAFPVNNQTPGVNTPNGNIFDPDPGAVIYDPGPPPTTRIGEYFGICVWGGTAYVAWNGNTFAGFNNPANQQVWTTAFAIRGSLTVTGTPGNDFITVRSMADNPDFVEVIVNGQRQYVGLWSALTGITVNATSGDDYVQIDDIVADRPVTVNLGNGADGVDLGRAATDLDNIQGPVVVHGGSGTDTLFLRDANHAGNVSYTFAGSVFSRTGSSIVSYDHMALVQLGAGTVSTVNVLGALTNPVTIAGFASPALNIDDRSNTSDTTYTITSSSVAWTGSAILRYGANGPVTNLVVTGGSGNNTYNVQSTPTVYPTTLYTGNGADTVNVRGTAGPLFVNSGSGSDTITLSNSTNTLGGIGRVIVNDPSNRATLTVDDSAFASNTTYTLTSTQVAAAAWPSFLLVYNNLASLNLIGGSGDDSIDIESTAGATATTVTGGSGNNRFDLTPTAQYLAAVAGPLSLLGSGADTLVFWDTANPNAETYTFDDIPSHLTLATVPVSINFFGIATVYLETNGMSTVNDSSGTVLVDVLTPSSPHTAHEPPMAPSVAAADGLVQALLDAAQEWNATDLGALFVSDALSADRIGYAARFKGR
jgi:hypothetical protein